MLAKTPLTMQPKDFAVGYRVQHFQEQIDESQYGKQDETCREALGAASYKLTAQTKDGRGVYSFCMCPGGYVVNASSEKGRLAVNGMSYHDRGSGVANAGSSPYPSEDLFRHGASAYIKYPPVLPFLQIGKVLLCIVRICP